MRIRSGRVVLHYVFRYYLNPFLLSRYVCHPRLWIRGYWTLGDHHIQRVASVVYTRCFVGRKQSVIGDHHRSRVCSFGKLCETVKLRRS